jgi:hypothetical protein
MGMRSTILSFLVLATTAACSSLGDAALADSPPSWPASQASPAALRWTPHVEAVDDDVHTLPTFYQGGRRFILGSIGQRYRLKVVNPTGSRVEAVVSVDGLDAVDGKPASLDKRGYIVPAHGELTIDGWRTSLDSVAAFRFSSVRSSYAARTGHDRNVGVIGVAFFREHVVEPVEEPVPVGRERDDEMEAPTPRSSAAPAAPPADAPATKGAAAPAAAEERSDAPAASAPARRSAAAARPGLGTEFGEAHASSVSEVTFERAGSSPDIVSELRYDDRAGLEARGIRTTPRPLREEENARRDQAVAFPETRFAQPPR